MVALRDAILKSVMDAEKSIVLITWQAWVPYLNSKSAVNVGTVLARKPAGRSLTEGLEKGTKKKKKKKKDHQKNVSTVN